MRNTHLINWPGQILVVFCVLSAPSDYVEPGSRPTGVFFKDQCRSACHAGQMNSESWKVKHSRAKKLKRRFWSLKRQNWLLGAKWDGGTFNFWLKFSGISKTAEIELLCLGFSMENWQVNRTNSIAWLNDLWKWTSWIMIMYHNIISDVYIPNLL